MTIWFKTAEGSAIASGNKALVVRSLAAVRPRVDSIDLLRGVIMLLMALDHTRDFSAQLVWTYATWRSPHSF